MLVSIVSSVVLPFSLILKNCHRSVAVNCITCTFVGNALQILLKGVLTIVEDLLVISESIYYFVCRLYVGAFVTCHISVLLFYP